MFFPGFSLRLSRDFPEVFRISGRVLPPLSFPPSAYRGGRKGGGGREARATAECRLIGPMDGQV